MADYTRILNEHIDGYLGPILKKSPGKKVLFLDYVVNGSFKDALSVFNSYLLKSAPLIQHDYLAFGSNISAIGQEDWLPSEKFIDLGKYEWEFHRKLKTSHYERFAEHEGWIPEVIPNKYIPPKANPNYNLLKNEIIEDMGKDHDLLKTSFFQTPVKRHLSDRLSAPCEFQSILNKTISVSESAK